MKKTNVYLQYPWKFPDSPYYKYLVENGPKQVHFMNVKKPKGVITSKKFFWFSNFLKRNIRRTLNTLNLAVPNAHLTKDVEGVDLIHCAHCLSKNQDKPWVADMEMLPSMLISGWNSKRGIRKVLKILKQDNCKKIMPWTNVMYEEFCEKFPEVKDKFEVVYPATPVNLTQKKISKGKLKLIFIARYFDIKGGRIALEALERLRKKYGIEGIVVSSVPEDLKIKYSKLKINDLMPFNDLLELMKSSDIFFYPSMVDTFGFSLLEAMSFGMPIVTVNTDKTKSRNEIIENGKHGVIFDVEGEVRYDLLGEKEERIIDRLVEETGKLIKDKKLLQDMANNCIKEIKEGKFSIDSRNKKLMEIYQEAIK